MKNRKKFFTISLSLIILGILISGVAWILGGRPGIYIDSSGIHSTSSNENKRIYTMKKTKLDQFSNVDITIDYAKCNIIPSDGYYLEYSMTGNTDRPQYYIDNDKLTFKQTRNKGSKFSINFLVWEYGLLSDNSNERENYLNLYVPKDKYYSAFNIKLDSGDIDIDDIQIKSMYLEADYGNINLGSFKGKNLNISMESGEMKIENINVDNVEIDNSYGDININNINCKTASFGLDSGEFRCEKAVIGKLDASNEYGDIIFKEVVCKNGSVDLDSGILNMNAADIGELKVNNEYGNIKIDTVNKIDDYNLDLETEYGTIKAGDKYESDSGQKYKINNGKGKSITAFCESGDIVIDSLN